VTQAPLAPSTRTDRRVAVRTPVPNPGRRASDRESYLAELAASSGNAPLADVPRWLRHYSRQLLVADAAIGLVSALLALVVRFGSDAQLPYVVITVLFPLGWVALVAGNRAYEPRYLGAGAEEYRRLTQATLRYGGLIAITAYAVHSPLARGYLFVALPLAYVLGLGARRLARRELVRSRRLEQRCQHRVVVAGTERASAELIRQVHAHPEAGFKVVAACITRARHTEVEGVPIVGTSTQLFEALTVSGADTVAVAAWSDLTHSDLRRLCWRLEGSGVTVVVAPTITDVAGPRIHIRPVAGLPLLHVEQPEFRGVRRWLKSLLDRSVSLLALLALSPLLLAVGLAVRLTSRGPALFHQTRVGEHGKTFTMLKFRSMYADAESRLAALQEQNHNGDGLLFKMPQDPRVTPIGRFLRRFSLDELPQLVNVLGGQMSLVGPRPPLVHEVSRYGGDVGRRLLVRPGLTGLWQVSGRSELSWEQAVRLDLEYVENWSLSLDLLILWRTMAAVIRSRGAY